MVRRTKFIPSYFDIQRIVAFPWFLYATKLQLVLPFMLMNCFAMGSKILKRFFILIYSSSISKSWISCKYQSLMMPYIIFVVNIIILQLETYWLKDKSKRERFREREAWLNMRNQCKVKTRKSLESWQMTVSFDYDNSSYN